jgi:hypothetical protein
MNKKTIFALTVAALAVCFGTAASAQVGSITEPNAAVMDPPMGGVGAGGIQTLNGTWSFTGLWHTAATVQNRSTTSALWVVMSPGSYFVSQAGDGEFMYVVSLWGSNDNGTTTCVQYIVNMDTGSTISQVVSSSAQGKTSLTFPGTLQTGHLSSSIACLLPPFRGNVPHAIYGVLTPSLL